MKTLILDGHNLLHRARAGFQLGDFNVVYNFFRSLKPLIELFKPTRVLFTLEGAPKRQLKLLPSYKANRIVDTSTPEGEKKHQELKDFHRQKDIIVKLLKERFPVSVVQHPDFEADDLIHNVIKNASAAVEFTVVSTDTDFIQLTQRFPNVRLYNPVKKEYVEAPDHDYVIWKALRGDGSDNIPSLPGIGDGKDRDFVASPQELQGLLLASPELDEQFLRNLELIKFVDWSDEECMGMTSSTPARDWEAVRTFFESCDFKSFLKESYWTKFVATFDSLWEVKDECASVS